MRSDCMAASEKADLHSRFLVPMVVDLYMYGFDFGCHLHNLQDSRSSLPILPSRHPLFLYARENIKKLEQTLGRGAGGI